MILVVGSTGLLGGTICRLLAKKGIPISAFVRDTSDSTKVERLRGYGANIVKGDLRDVFSLTVACRGTEAVICTASALNRYQDGRNDFQTVDLQGIRSLVDEAVKAGVSRFIFPSFSGSIVLQSPLLDAKRSVERYIKESPLVYTIIRSSFFMETCFSPEAGFDPIQAKVTILGKGKDPHYWISIKDVAQIMVQSVYEPSMFNKSIEVSGPEALSLNQVVSLFEASGKRKFEINYQPENMVRFEKNSPKDPRELSLKNLLIGYACGEKTSDQARLDPTAMGSTSVEDYSKAVFGQENRKLASPGKK
jgi:uncharacterized protein YbjT (DUF2867 family)